MLNNHYVLLHLSLIPRVGPMAIDQLARSKPAHVAWTDLYAYSMSDMCAWGIDAAVATRVATGLTDHALVEQELALFQKHTDMHWMTRYDDAFPQSLQHIVGVPPVLYWMGSPLSPKDAHALAVVGSRAAGEYAQAAIDLLLPPLVQLGWTIVSGGALGADSMAHTVTMNKEGKTIVVLGSGLLRWYPQENKRLFERVVSSGGTLVTTFPLRTAPHAGNFPARNRIIAGLSRGCLVVQAAYKSGATITAQYALDQGKEVFAVPGLITDPLSEGCHYWLQQGATLVTHAQDIVRAFGQELEREPREVTIRPSESASQPSKPLKQTEHVQQSVLHEISDTPSARILSMCKTPQFLDDLVVHTGFDRDLLQGLLCELQCDGLVTCTFVGQWVRV